MDWSKIFMESMREHANTYRLLGVGNSPWAREALTWHEGRVSASALIARFAAGYEDSEELKQAALVNEARFLATTYQRS